MIHHVLRVEIYLIGAVKVIQMVVTVPRPGESVHHDVHEVLAQ